MLAGGSVRLARPTSLTARGTSTMGCDRIPPVMPYLMPCVSPQVFKKIEKQLPQLMSLDLQYVSPALLKARNLELAVPGNCVYLIHFSLANLNVRLSGTYQSGEPIVKIKSFSTKLSVIASKQRPRRVALTGDDGNTYEFVLKGTLRHVSGRIEVV
jgi:phosphatidylinositol kinase/protein kinase (PI-3  family)